MRQLSFVGALVACTSFIAAHAGPASGVHRGINLPMVFETNRGQSDARAALVARVDGANVYMTQSGALLSIAAARRSQREQAAAEAPVPWRSTFLNNLAREQVQPRDEIVRAVALHYRFAGANPHPRIEPLDRLPGRSNYLIGDDPRQWRTDIAQFGRVRYHDVYRGVDVVFYGNDGQLEFDVEVAPGADLEQVRLRIEGADALLLDDSGDLRVQTALGELTQPKPLVYQRIGGERRKLLGSYVLHDNAREVAFSVPAYDRSLALVLDPTLVWTSQVGGSSNDSNNSVAVDASGNWYFAGSSDFSALSNFPTTVGAFQTINHGSTDAFVRKVSNDGATILYSTLLGGSGIDAANGIGVDGTGIAYIAGNTYSNNFPTTPGALQSAKPGGAQSSGFVTALNAAGNGLVYSSYLGGSSTTYAFGIAADALGNAYVTGETTALDLPTSAAAFQTTSQGQYSAYVFKFAANGSRVFGSYIVDDYFGLGGDHGAKIAIDGDGNSYIVGYTNSFFGGSSYNGVMPAQIGPGGGSYDILVARLNHTGQSLDWVTRIGGSSIDKGTAIAVDRGHHVMVAGWSASSDLPPVFTNNDDWGWIGELDATGSQVLDATFVGAAGAATFPEALVWDELLVVGSAQKPSALPATNAVAGLDCGAQCGGNSSYGGFLALLSTGPLTVQSLTRILAATGFDTRFHDIAQDPNSNTGRAAIAAGGNGTFPGTPPGDTSQSADAAVVDVVPAALKPPIVAKSFGRTSVDPGDVVRVTILIVNPNSVPITELSVGDVLPACLGQFLYLGNISPSLYVDRNSSPGEVLVGLKPSFTIDAHSPAAVTFYVKTTALTEFCTNTTTAATSDLGTALPASATVEKGQPSCAAVSSGTCSSMNMSNTSCWNGGAAPANTCSAEIMPCSGGTCTITNDQPTDAKISTLILDGNATIAGGDLYLSHALKVANGANAGIGMPVRAVNDSLAFAGNGRITFSGGVSLAQTDLGLNTTGPVDFANTVDGTGNVYLAGGEADFDVSPTFSGRIDVLAGLLVANAAMTQPIFLDGAGTLRGCTSCGDVTLAGGGDFHPCTGSAPCTSSVDALTCDGGKIEQDCGTNNTPCGAINASAAFDNRCEDITLHMQAQPLNGAVFNNLVTGSSVTCSAENVHATPANVIVKAQCTATTFSLVVQGLDGIFHSSF